MTTKSALRSSDIGSADVVKRWPTARSKIWTDTLLSQAADDDNIVAIIAIGSAVRPNVESVDLDLVMICDADCKSSNSKPPLEIDLRTYKAANVDDEIARGNDLLGWAVKFGVLLYQRGSYWDTVVASWRDRLPLPSRDIANRRAEEAYRRFREVFDIGDVNAARELALSYLTHAARAELLSRSVYPASRPELPGQLRAIGVAQLASSLEQLMNGSVDHRKFLAQLRTMRPSDS